MKGLKVLKPEGTDVEEGLQSKTLKRNKKTVVFLSIIIILSMVSLMIVGKSVSGYFYRYHVTKTALKRMCTVHDSRSFDTPPNHQLPVLGGDEKLSELTKVYQRKFIHDFENNVAGIVDISEKRCFFMPINRTLMPRNVALESWAKNLWKRLHRTKDNVSEFMMKVIVPPINDTSLTGRYIYEECRNYPIYKLEKSVVSKQDASRTSANTAKYSDILGAIKQEIYIVNIDDTLAYEKNSS